MVYMVIWVCGFRTLNRGREVCGFRTLHGTFPQTYPQKMGYFSTSFPQILHSFPQVKFDK